jgi:hypothetical protein
VSIIRRIAINIERFSPSFVILIKPNCSKTAPGVKNSWKKMVKRSKKRIGLKEASIELKETFENNTSKITNAKKRRYAGRELNKKSRITK